jgi:hypothetical protein
MLKEVKKGRTYKNTNTIWKEASAHVRYVSDNTFSSYHTFTCTTKKVTKFVYFRSDKLGNTKDHILWCVTARRMNNLLVLCFYVTPTIAY